MPDDIRIHVGFKDHIKTKKLLKMLGAEGLKSLIFLWLSARETRPKGNLDGLTDEDIELMGDWSGQSNVFVSALVSIGWIDKGEDGKLSLHDWDTWQKFAFYSEERSAQASDAATIRWEKKSRAKRMRPASDSHPDGNAPSPSPIPNPSPVPSPNPSPSEKPPSEAEVMMAWNSIEAFRKVDSFGVERKRALAARNKDPHWVANWRSALQQATSSDFCKGKNDRGWVANVEWFLRAETVNKILEGTYDNRGNGGGGQESLFPQKKLETDYSKFGTTISNVKPATEQPANGNQ